MKYISITIKAIYSSIAILFLSSSISFGGQCTGFFISPDGYIGTAGHCRSEGLSVEMIDSNGKHTIVPARMITYKADPDFMIIKVDTQNHPFFELSTAIPDLRTSLYSLGFPHAEGLGKYVKLHKGKFLDNYGSSYNIAVWVAPGGSGGPVINSNGSVIGITVTYSPASGGPLSFGLESGVTAIGTLINSAINFNVPITIDNTSPLNNQGEGKELLDRYKTAVVIIWTAD